jgi:hypothetical protein
MVNTVWTIIINAFGQLSETVASKSCLSCPTLAYLTEVTSDSSAVQYLVILQCWINCFKLMYMCIIYTFSNGSQKNVFGITDDFCKLIHDKHMTEVLSSYLHLPLHICHGWYCLTPSQFLSILLLVLLGGASAVWSCIRCANTLTSTRYRSWLFLV